MKTKFKKNLAVSTFVISLAAFTGCGGRGRGRGWCHGSGRW